MGEGKDRKHKDGIRAIYILFTTAIFLGLAVIYFAFTYEPEKQVDAPKPRVTLREVEMKDEFVEEIRLGLKQRSKLLEDEIAEHQKTIKEIIAQSEETWGVSDAQCSFGTNECKILTPIFTGMGTIPVHIENNILFIDDDRANGLKVDGESFERFGALRYSKDSISAIAIFYGDTKFRRIPFSDPNTFQIIDAPLSRDKNHVFFRYEVLKNADPKTFTHYKEHSLAGFWRDKDSVFYKGNELNGADPNNFRRVYVEKLETKALRERRASLYISPDIYGESNYVRDENNIYYETAKLDEVDAKNAIALSKYYLTDGQNVFFKEQKMANVDAESFQVVDGVRAKDKNGAYIRGERVE